MLDFTAWLNLLADQYGYLGVLIASFIANATIFFPTPIQVIVYALGARLDPWLLGVSAGIGAALGELVGYVIGYGLEQGVKISQSRFEKQHRFTKAVFDRWGFWAVVLFALTPLPDDILGIIAGMVKYPVAKFFAASLIGKIAMYCVIAWAGAYSFAFVNEVFGGFGEMATLAVFVLLVVLVIVVGKLMTWDWLLEKLGENPSVKPRRKRV